MEHPNVLIAREAYEDFARGDLASLGTKLAADAVWHVPGLSPLAGDYKGQDEIFGLFGRLFEMSGGTIALEVRDVLANDEHVTVLCHMNARRGDAILDQDAVHVMQIDDGKVKEFWSFDYDQRADDEFWS